MTKWKTIKGFKNYEVSRGGRVKSGRLLLKATPANNGYPRVSLRKNNKTFYRSMHRLVAEAFLRGFTAKSMINHKDKNKLNNRLSNLELSSHTHNNAHSWRGKKRGVRFEERRSHYVAQLWCREKKKYIYLGSFSSERKAYKVYYENYLLRYGVKPW